MANETNNDFSVSISNIMDTLTKLGQQQAEILNNTIPAIEPLVKTCTELISNVLGSANQALQSFSASIAPKK
ncbi:MAG: chlorosome envelope protein B [Chlorobium sp.]|jgi:chlorosome envelope protein B|nr:chlorosome envelope protein B [Chlorobium sp.]